MERARTKTEKTAVRIIVNLLVQAIVFAIGWWLGAPGWALYTNILLVGASSNIIRIEKAVRRDE